MNDFRFDVQAFGDNDTLTSSRELKLDYLFSDGDTRTTSLPYPKTNLTAAQINSASQTLADTQAFVGDKNNGAFVKIQSAYMLETTRRKLDLS